MISYINQSEYDFITYRPAPMPRHYQKLLNILSWALLIFDALTILLWLLLKLELLSVTPFSKTLYYGSAITTSVLYCSYKIIAFNLYYNKWYAKSHQPWFLQAAQIISGFVLLVTILILLANAVTNLQGIALYITLMVPFLILVSYFTSMSHLQNKRKLKIKNLSHTSSQNPPLITRQIGYQINFSEEIPISANSDANHSTASTAATTPKSQTIQPSPMLIVVVDPKQELIKALLILAYALICDIMACLIAIQFVSYLYSDDLSTKMLGTYITIGLLIPFFISAIIIFCLAHSRINHIKSRNQQKQCEAAIIICKIARILASLPIILCIASIGLAFYKLILTS